MPRPFITTAVITDHKLQVRNRALLDQWLQLEKNGEYTLTIERLHATRSLAQNALYFKAFVQPLADEYGWTLADMHAYLRTRFMPPHQRKTKTLLLVNRRTGEVIDEITVDDSTTTRLNKVEFSEYLRDIQVWAAGLGVEVGAPPPSPPEGLNAD